MRSIFMFRRDLRLDDNTGLIQALYDSEDVIPIFIFNPKQVENNEYKGDHSFEFLLNSLEDLNKQLEQKGSRLYVFYGNPVEVLNSLSFDTLYFNKDYTPFSIERDRELEKHFTVKSFDDILLNAPDMVSKDDGTFYTVFTPYYKKAITYEIHPPVVCEKNNFFNKTITGTTTISEMRKRFLKKSNPNLAVYGGRKEALELLNRIKEKLEGYKKNRDIPAIDGVSKLSAHNKFGTISPREVLYETYEGEAFTRQLYWRDFFTQIAYHNPRVFGGNFNRSYDTLEWDYDLQRFEAWCNGKTGFPIVDAGMRELNETGYMHNRLRMIVASFLTKDLHIDWRWGEQYFAQKLVDYDPCVNNGSWQWASSTGCDAQPYFRIFNPWRQQIRFDKNCEYIKKWIPELKNLSADTIHTWGNKNGVQRTLVEVDYPKPIIDHFKEKEETLRRFKSK